MMMSTVSIVVVTHLPDPPRKGEGSREWSMANVTSATSARSTPVASEAIKGINSRSRRPVLRAVALGCGKSTLLRMVEP